jgi:sec-independent protein translocase protein TatA
MQTSIYAFIGTGEAVIIGIVFLVLFGAKKVPELMKGLGQGMREFKKASREIQDELERAGQEPPTPPPAPRKPADSVPQASPAPHVEPVSADAPAWSKPNH